jgi:hypothetical protein
MPIPPTASPVYLARFSVDVLITRAAGMIERAAEKKTSGAVAWPYSSISVMGMKMRSHLNSRL